MYHGWVPDLHIHAEDTLLPFYLGEKDDVTYAIKPTCWPGLDIIPSCLALHRIETELMGKFDEGKLPTDPHLMLRLAIETVAHDYDVIVIDSAPNLGIGTINVVCAADVLIVPTPAELFDYTSALQFFDMLRDLLKNVDLKPRWDRAPKIHRDGKTPDSLPWRETPPAARRWCKIGRAHV